jgi:transcriptional regulator with XRE-family HTH domain
MNTVGERLSYVRNQKGMTLEQLAQKAGISKSFLWEVEHDKSNISGARLLRVANVLGASLDFLLRGEPAPADYIPPAVEISRALEELAEELSLTYWQTRTLLDLYKTILYRRSEQPSPPMEKEDWRQLYEGVKHLLVEKR